MPPLIAVARTSKNDDYLASLEPTGATVRLIDADGDDAETIVRSADGLMLLGGMDVDPSFYGETRHPACAPVARARDAFELALARLAVEHDRPLLAICRGLQVLNVALGGSLVQDIPSQLGSPLNHDLREPKDGLAHAVAVRSGSRLGRILDAEGATIDVNSRHHQSLEKLGAGLVVSAVAPDGIIEAAEVPGLRFCVGVQWHPENFLATGRFQSLFDALTLSAS